MSQDKAGESFQPKVVAYCCTYCAYTAGDLAGSMRLEYSPNVRVVKILCSGKIDAILLLRAFEDGADAVYVAGCALGDCHFLEGNLRAIQTVAYTKKLMAEINDVKITRSNFDDLDTLFEIYNTFIRIREISALVNQCK